MNVFVSKFVKKS